MGKQSRRANRRKRPGRVRQKVTTGGELTVVIVTGPSQDENGDPSVEQELRLVRSALMYADKVELVSPSATMLGAMAAAASTDPDLTLDIFRGLDDDALTYLSQGQDDVAAPDELRAAMEFVASIKALPRTQRTALYRMPGGEAIREVMRRFDSHERELRSGMYSIWAGAGGAEIEAAMEAGVLDIRTDFFPLDGDTDAQVAGFVETLKVLMSSGLNHLLLDDSTSSLARSLLAEGELEEHPLSAHNSLTLRAGTGFAERLPAFPDANVKTVLAAKRDLQPQLTRYRKAMGEVSTRLQTSAHDPALRTELDTYWRDEVAPAIEAVRKDLSATDLVKTVASDVGGVALSAAGGAFGLASVWVALHTSALATIPAALGAVGPAVRTATRQRSEARERDVFYLYELNNRLS